MQQAKNYFVPCFRMPYSEFNKNVDLIHFWKRTFH